jgi:hypothetical protein
MSDIVPSGSVVDGELAIEGRNRRVLERSGKAPLSRAAFEDVEDSSSQSEIKPEDVPDLGDYFRPFGLSADHEAKICRAYASYLVTTGAAQGRKRAKKE